MNSSESMSISPAPENLELAYVAPPPLPTPEAVVPGPEAPYDYEAEALPFLTANRDADEAQINLWLREIGLDPEQLNMSVADLKKVLSNAALLAHHDVARAKGVEELAQVREVDVLATLVPIDSDGALLTADEATARKIVPTIDESEAEDEPEATEGYTAEELVEADVDLQEILAGVEAGNLDLSIPEGAAGLLEMNLDEVAVDPDEYVDRLVDLHALVRSNPGIEDGGRAILTQLTDLHTTLEIELSEDFDERTDARTEEFAGIRAGAPSTESASISESMEAEADETGAGTYSQLATQDGASATHAEYLGLEDNGFAQTIATFPNEGVNAAIAAGAIEPVTLTVDGQEDIRYKVINPEEARTILYKSLPKNPPVEVQPSGPVAQKAAMVKAAAQMEEMTEDPAEKASFLERNKRIVVEAAKNVQGRFKSIYEAGSASLGRIVNRLWNADQENAYVNVQEAEKNAVRIITQEEANQLDEEPGSVLLGRLDYNETVLVNVDQNDKGQNRYAVMLTGDSGAEPFSFVIPTEAAAPIYAQLQNVMRVTPSGKYPEGILALKLKEGTVMVKVGEMIAAMQVVGEHVNARVADQYDPDVLRGTGSVRDNSSSRMTAWRAGLPVALKGADNSGANAVVVAPVFDQRGQSVGERVDVSAPVDPDVSYRKEGRVNEVNVNAASLAANDTMVMRLTAAERAQLQAAATEANAPVHQAPRVNARHPETEANVGIVAEAASHQEGREGRTVAGRIEQLRNERNIEGLREELGEQASSLGRIVREERLSRRSEIVEVPDDIPTVVIRDVHARPEVIVNSLIRRMEVGFPGVATKGLDRDQLLILAKKQIAEGKLSVVLLGDYAHTENQQMWLDMHTAQHNGNKQQLRELMSDELANYTHVVSQLVELKELAAQGGRSENVVILKGNHDDVRDDRLAKGTYYAGRLNQKGEPIDLDAEGNPIMTSIPQSASWNNICLDEAARRKVALFEKELPLIARNQNARIIWAHDVPDVNASQLQELLQGRGYGQRTMNLVNWSDLSRELTDEKDVPLARHNGILELLRNNLIGGTQPILLEVGHTSSDKRVDYANGQILSKAFRGSLPGLSLYNFGSTKKSR